MAIVTYEELAAQVGLTGDAPDDDKALLQQKGKSAQSHVERLLGFKVEERYPDPATIPPALTECVLQLAAWWFENREAASTSDKLLPFGVRDIVDEFKDWAF